MARVTTAFDAKDNLETLVKSLQTDPGNVYYGHPGSDVPDYSEWIWIGEIEWDSDEPESLGNRASNEVYRIILTVESHVPADTQREANARVKVKMHAVQNALVANANPLSIPNVISTRLEPQFLGEGNNSAGSGRGAILVLSVRVEARK